MTYPRYALARSGTRTRLDPRRFRRGRGPIHRAGVKRWKILPDLRALRQPPSRGKAGRNHRRK